MGRFHHDRAGPLTRHRPDLCGYARHWPGGVQQWPLRCWRRWRCGRRGQPPAAGGPAENPRSNFRRSSLHQPCWDSEFQEQLAAWVLSPAIDALAEVAACFAPVMRGVAIYKTLGAGEAASQCGGWWVSRAGGGPHRGRQRPRDPEMFRVGQQPRYPGTWPALWSLRLVLQRRRDQVVGEQG